MKSREEIENLAKQLCNIPIDLVINEEERYYKNFQKYDGIIQGYTQCQEDMADKKYTEEDMMIIRNKLVSTLPTYDISAWDMLQSVSKYIKWFDEYINSLNKQD